jgi:alkaline phosphatase
MSYAIDRKDSELTLADYTAKGIEMLDNENGFFMMVEGGKIDWASHANDAATVVYDVLDFDAAVNEALKFYKLHPEETLIIVTADHETGGLGLGFSGMGYKTDFALLTQQKISSALFSEKAEKWIDDKIPFETIMDSVSFYYGLNDTSQYSTAKLSEEEYNRIRKAYEKSITGTDGTTQDYIIYGSYNPFTTLVTRILNEKAGIGWTSFSHTCSPVPVFAIGAGSHYFEGYYDNTDIPKKIIQVSEIE